MPPTDYGGATGGSGSEAYAWHFDMLHDQARVEAFAQAFDRLPGEVFAGATALDVGCGSGILGLSLLHKFPELACVVAVDVDAAVAEVAQENARLSGLNGRLIVRACHSTSLRSLLDVGAGFKAADRANLVVCEILDAGLLGEDCIPTLRHAAKQLLTSDYRAVPARAEIFACAVESALLSSWQHLRDDIPFFPQTFLEDDGDSNPHDVALERLMLANEVKVLSSEFKTLTVDFENLPIGVQQEAVVVEACQSGRIDAIVFWWCCFMVRNDRVASLCNAPTWAASASHLGKRGEIDHWRQAVCVLPRPAWCVSKGDHFRVIALHNDEDVWFRIAAVEALLPPVPQRMPQGSSRLSTLSHTRMWMLGDQPRRTMLQDAMHYAITHLKIKPWHEHAGLVVLDLSDGPILSLVAFEALAKQARKHHRCRRDPLSRRLRKMFRLVGWRPTVMCLESSEQDAYLAKDAVSPYVSSTLKRCSGNSNKVPCLQIIQGSPTLPPNSVAALVAEPYSRDTEAHPCDVIFWQHWAQIDALRWTLRSDAILIPTRFRVWSILVVCPGLWRRRQPICKEVVHGVNISAINHLHPDVLEERPRKRLRRGHRSREQDLNCASVFRTRFACGLWQVSHTLNSEPSLLCEVDLREAMPPVSKKFPASMLHMTDTTLGAHAIATWVEAEVMPGRWLKTGAPVGDEFAPSYGFQGILLARHLQGSGSEVKICTRFDVADGTLRMNARWSGGEEF